MEAAQLVLRLSDGDVQGLGKALGDSCEAQESVAVRGKSRDGETGQRRERRIQV